MLAPISSVLLAISPALLTLSLAPSCQAASVKEYITIRPLNYANPWIWFDRTAEDVRVRDLVFSITEKKVFKYEGPAGGELSLPGTLPTLGGAAGSGKRRLGLNMAREEKRGGAGENFKYEGAKVGLFTFMRPDGAKDGQGETYVRYPCHIEAQPDTPLSGINDTIFHFQNDDSYISPCHWHNNLRVVCDEPKPATCHESKWLFLNSQTTSPGLSSNAASKD